MREIKFRTWDKKDKEMYEWGKISKEFTLEYFEEESLEFMQYTGLKDKNGVEIYEGDVVKYQNRLVGYVTFIIQEAGFVVVLKNSDYRLGHINTNELYDSANNHEVIGNIYENPELLNG